jgi:hypothetical protein
MTKKWGFPSPNPSQYHAGIAAAEAERIFQHMFLS